MTMRNRIWALAQVGMYIGENEMLAQVKGSESRDIYNWLKLAYASRHGMSQEMEGKANERYMEVVMINKSMAKKIYEHCRNIVLNKI